MYTFNTLSLLFSVFPLMQPLIKSLYLLWGWRFPLLIFSCRLSCVRVSFFRILLPIIIVYGIIWVYVAPLHLQLSIYHSYPLIQDWIGTALSVFSHISCCSAEASKMSLFIEDVQLNIINIKKQTNTLFCSHFWAQH